MNLDQLKGATAIGGGFTVVLLAAYLDRKSKTSHSAPPAMEPTA